MNEFIVWDEDNQQFSTFDELMSDEWCVSELDENGQIFFKYSNCAEDDWEHEYVEMNTKLFYGIGKTDINGKKIYADSSIVEFDYETMGKKYNMIGYFKYNNKKLSYDIISLNKLLDIELFTYPCEAWKFKIIDTVQENKLGLIKCTT